MFQEEMGDWLQEQSGDRILNEGNGERMLNEGSGERMLNEGTGERILNEGSGERMQPTESAESMLHQAEKRKLIHEIENIKKKLKEAILCSVCHNVPRSERIPICRNGHVSCEGCFRETCPTCRTTMNTEDDEDEDEDEDEDNHLPRKMFSPLSLSITELLDYNCIYAEEGCKVTLKKGDIQIHEKGCDYHKNIPCPAPKCKSLVSRHSIGNHVLTCEHVKISKDTLTLGKQISKKFTKCFVEEVAYFGTLVFKLKDSEDLLYLVSVEDVESSSSLVFMRLLSTDMNKEYSVKIEISDLDETISKSYLGKTLTMKNAYAIGVKEGNVLEIPGKMMGKMWTKKKKDKFSYKINITVDKIKEKQKVEIDEDKDFEEIIL